MKGVLTLAILTITLAGTLAGQNPIKPKPAYCDQPTEYSNLPPPARKPLPEFATQSKLEYRVQVAVLRNTDPRNFHFHSSLIARYQPCEEVWIVESRASFANKLDAERLRQELKKLGYPDPYITTLVTYE